MLLALVAGLALPAAALAAAPTNTVAPQLNGFPRESQALSSDTGTWTSAEPIAYTYAWLRCRGGECTPIPGAGAPKYVLSDADLGASLRVRTATNPTLSARADSEPIGPVNGPAPAATGNPTVAVEGGTGTKAKVGVLAHGGGRLRPHGGRHRLQGPLRGARAQRREHRQPLSASTDTVVGIPPAAVTRPVVTLAGSELRDGCA